MFIYSKHFLVLFPKKLSHCVSTYCGFRFLSTKGHKLKVESKTGINKMQFSDCQNPNINICRNPSMHETCKNMLARLIKNLIVASVRPLHPKENFSNNVCFRSQIEKKKNIE